MYGKFINHKFVKENPDMSKPIAKQHLDMLLKGFIPVVEVENPGLGYVCNYTRNKDVIVQFWEYSKEKHIQDLKQRLADTDYVVIKIAEGVSTIEDYADIIAQRQEWRTQINELMVQE